MNTELPVTNRQFLIILLTNAESSVDCCRYNLDLLRIFMKGDHSITSIEIG